MSRRSADGAPRASLGLEARASDPMPEGTKGRPRPISLAEPLGDLFLKAEARILLDLLNGKTSDNSRRDAMVGQPRPRPCRRGKVVPAAPGPAEARPGRVSSMAGAGLPAGAERKPAQQALAGRRADARKYKALNQFCGREISPEG